MRGRQAKHWFRPDHGRKVIILVACAEGFVLIFALVTIVTLWLYLGRSFS